MTKCIHCKVGDVIVSGSHAFCSNCNLSRFFVTDDYINSCASLVGTICSNMIFTSEESYMSFVEQAIDNHLPLLSNWICTIMSGAPDFMLSFATLSKLQAINLDIAGIVENEENKNDLVCSCGCDVFYGDVGNLLCQSCDSAYKYDHEKSTYMPIFKCDFCSVNHYRLIDQFIVECGGCDAGFIKQNDTFIPIGEAT